jgi:hypothetical protein
MSPVIVRIGDCPRFGPRRCGVGLDVGVRTGGESMTSRRDDHALVLEEEGLVGNGDFMARLACACAYRLR